MIGDFSPTKIHVLTQSGVLEAHVANSGVGLRSSDVNLVTPLGILESSGLDPFTIFFFFVWECVA